MRISEFLHQIDLGHEAAERDRSLEKVFVATADYTALRRGAADLVTGIKGSGKSALFLMLLSQGALDEKVRLVKAQNAQGPLVYARDLPDDRLLLTSDEYFRQRWIAHAIALAVNDVLARHPGAEELRPLAQLAQDVGLFVPDPDEYKVWERSGKWRLLGTAWPSPQESDAVGPRDGEQAMKQLTDAFVEAVTVLDEEIWVLFDRLDDVLVFDPERERAMLRGLLAAMVSVASISDRFKVKAFMRHDLILRVTEERPVRNIDQLQRIRLRWNARQIMQLVANRLTQVPEAGVGLGVGPLGAPPLAKKVVDDIWQRLIHMPPAWVAKAKGDAAERRFHVLFDQTVDGSGQYNPRVVLTFLRLLFQEQAASSENDPRELPLPGPSGIITAPAINRALVNLSQMRLEGYLYAEFQHLRPHIHRLEGGSNAFGSTGALRHALRLRDDRDANEIVRSLCACGLLRHDPRTDRYAVAKLYKGALRVKNRVYYGPGSPERSVKRA